MTVLPPQRFISAYIRRFCNICWFSSIFSLQRLKLNKVGLVGVVGTDFRKEDFAILSNAGLDTTGVEVVEGSTFHWVGSYHGNMAQAETHETHLNVFETFQPKVPEHGTSSKITFCANLHPAIQLSVLDQSHPTRTSMLDSMNLWINIAHDELIEAMKRVDIVVINDGEVTMLAESDNLVQAAKEVQAMAEIPTLIIKKGEHGVVALHGNDLIALPAYPTDAVVDPTGCGDTFAGTIAACLAAGHGPIERDELRTLSSMLLFLQVLPCKILALKDFNRLRMRRISIVVCKSIAQ